MAGSEALRAPTAANQSSVETVAQSSVANAEAVRGYETEELRNAVRLVRGGTVLVATLHVCFLATDLFRGLHQLIKLDLISVVLGLIAFGTTYTGWFTRRWRLLALGICMAEVTATAAAASLVSDPTRMLVTIILYSCGSACLVPWSPWWQQTLNLYFLLVLLLQMHATPTANAMRFDTWIAAIVSLGIGQFATAFGERHRHALYEAATAVDASDRQLRDEIKNRGTLARARDQTQDELARSQRLFELFMHRLPGPAFIRDKNGKYIYVNEKMVGRFSTTALLGKGYEDIGGLSPTEIQIIKDLDRQILETGDAVQIIETITGPPTRHWMVHKFPIPDQAGQIAMIGGMSVDITDRVNSEAALKESEQRFRLMVDEVRDYAIFMLDQNGVVVSWNAGAERMYAYTTEAILGHPLAVFYPEQDRASGKPQQELNVTAQEGRSEIEGIRVRGDSSQFLANVVTTALRDNSGNLVGFAKIVRDITERQRIEQERVQLVREQEARAQAERAVAARDEFLAVLSHELRNPLGAISNALALIHRVKNDGQLSERAYEIIGRQTRNLTHLVNDLLDLSRLATGKVNLERTSVNVRQVAERAVQSFSIPIAARRLQVEVCAPDAPIYIDADPVRFEQIISNLLDNAIKFTNLGDQISIGIVPTGTNATISVTDDGIGMKPATLGKIFNPFAQNEPGLARSTSGLGLGLSIVKSLVEQHGGGVSAFSEGEGRGAKFVITMPLAGAAIRPEPFRPGASLVEPAMNVVVADDDHDSLVTLKGVLELQGHRVITAADGPSAVSAILEHRPEVAIVDIRMPGFSGYEVAMRVRSQPWAGALLLIALTGHGSEADHARSLAAGFDAHLEKPADLSMLSRLMREHQPNAAAAVGG